MWYKQRKGSTSIVVILILLVFVGAGYGLYSYSQKQTALRQERREQQRLAHEQAARALEEQLKREEEERQARAEEARQAREQERQEQVRQQQRQTSTTSSRPSGTSGTLSGRSTIVEWKRATVASQVSLCRDMASRLNPKNSRYNMEPAKELWTAINVYLSSGHVKDDQTISEVAAFVSVMLLKWTD